MPPSERRGHGRGARGGGLRTCPTVSPGWACRRYSKRAGSCNPLIVAPGLCTQKRFACVKSTVACVGGPACTKLCMPMPNAKCTIGITYTHAHAHTRTHAHAHAHAHTHTRTRTRTHTHTLQPAASVCATQLSSMASRISDRLFWICFSSLFEDNSTPWYLVLISSS